MEKFKVSFEANNQQLKSIGTKHASDTYADIEAEFVLGNRWTDMDSVSAVWWNDFTRIATVLDSQGKCIVPHEVLTRKGCVRVNLVGSIVEGDELITRLTSYSAEAVQVNEKIKLTGNEPQSITPSQYEQFVQNVKADADRAEAGADEAEQSAQSASESATASANSASESAQSATASAQSAQNASESAISAENAKDDAEDARDKILGMRATAETLEAGSDATASYSDGLLTLGIPRGDRGEQGIQGETGATPNLTIGTVETLEPTEDATATITGTAEEPVLNLGIPKGDTGEVSLEDLEALLPTDTASGDIASITDGQSVVPVKSLKVTLEPIQDLHGYDKPWSGGNGKNLAYLEQGSLNMSTGAEEASTTRVRTNFIPVEQSTNYIASSQNSGWSIRNGVGYDANKDYVSNGIYPDASTGKFITTNTSVKYVRFIYSHTNTSEACTPSDYWYQFEEGSTATSYAPYSNECPITGRTECDTYVSPITSETDAEVYTTPLGRTVYGGTLDVVSGELVVDRAMVDLGTLNWSYHNSGSSLDPYFYATFSGIKSPGAPYIYPINAVCSQYQITKRAAGAFVNGCLCGDGDTTRITQIQIKDDRFTDPAAFKQAMSGVQLCYELATPQTIQLTPQEVQLLLGTNNVWSDGEVTLTYNADIQRYIEKKLNGNSTTLTMSRPMVQTETETEETE